MEHKIAREDGTALPVHFRCERINAAGEWIDRSETTSMNDLFDRMSTEELEEYAQRGALPKWFEAVAQTATGVDSQE